MPKTKITTITAELQDLVTRLVKAGIPPEVVGMELMATGAAFLHKNFGEEHVVRQCHAIIKTMRETPPEDNLPPPEKTKH